MVEKDPSGNCSRYAWLIRSDFISFSQMRLVADSGPCYHSLPKLWNSALLKYCSEQSWTHRHTLTHVHIDIYIYKYIYIYMCVCAYIYICAYNIYIYIYDMHTINELPSKSFTSE